MANGQKTGGRQSGTPNKVSVSAKENVIAVFNRLGGYEKMAEWALDNPNQFYSIYAKLLPIDVDITGTVNHELHLNELK